jgi:dTDP-4-dehydrorhamnose 3,5-epimerase
VKLTPDAEQEYRLQDYEPRAPIEGVEVVTLRRFNDDTGSMLELGRLQDGELTGVAGFRPAQVNYSTLEPGAIKAFHLHRRQTDVWFVPEHDRVLLVLVDVRDGSPTAGESRRLMLGDGRSALVRIPPGVAHGCRNLGSAAARILYFVDRPFSSDPADCDEGRLPWDQFGAALWEPSRD